MQVKLDSITEKFEEIFECMEYDEIIEVKLNIHEVTSILTSLVTTDAHQTILDQCITRHFEKISEKHECK